MPALRGDPLRMPVAVIVLLILFVIPGLIGLSIWVNSIGMIHLAEAICPSVLNASRYWMAIVFSSTFLASS